MKCRRKHDQWQKWVIRETYQDLSEKSGKSFMSTQFAQNELPHMDCHCLPCRPLKRQTKIAADDILIFYFYQRK